MLASAVFRRSRKRWPG